jgi:hypothetical protein
MGLKDELYTARVGLDGVFASQEPTDEGMDPLVDRAAFRLRWHLMV